MEDIRDEIYVVGYWCNVALVTTDRGLADQVCTKRRGEAPALPWAVRPVEDAILHAYAAGQEDGQI